MDSLQDPDALGDDQINEAFAQFEQEFEGLGIDLNEAIASQNRNSLDDDSRSASSPDDDFLSDRSRDTHHSDLASRSEEFRAATARYLDALNNESSHGGLVDFEALASASPDSESSDSESDNTESSTTPLDPSSRDDARSTTSQEASSSQAELDSVLDNEALSNDLLSGFYEEIDELVGEKVNLAIIAVLPVYAPSIIAAICKQCDLDALIVTIHGYSVIVLQDLTGGAPQQAAERLENASLPLQPFGLITKQAQHLTAVMYDGDEEPQECTPFQFLAELPDEFEDYLTGFISLDGLIKLADEVQDVRKLSDKAYTRGLKQSRELGRYLSRFIPHLQRRKSSHKSGNTSRSSSKQSRKSSKNEDDQ